MKPTMTLCAALLCALSLSACPSDDQPATDAGSSNGDAGQTAGQGGGSPSHGGAGGHAAGSGGKAEAGTGKAGTGGKAAGGSGGASNHVDEDAGVSTGKLCGTRGAGTCEDDQFCNFAPDKDCGQTDRGGMCEAKPKGCTKDLKWVCGCDNQDYSNECVAHAAGVSVKQPGKCSDATGKTCGGIANLQCGAKEFCNYEMGQGCNGAVADAAGKCDTKPDACTDQYQPVCGCDSKTYGNNCDAHSKGASVLHDGACTVSDCEKIGGRVAVGTGPAAMCNSNETEYTHIVNNDGSMAIEGMLCCMKK